MSADGASPDLLEDADRLIQALEGHPDPRVREQVGALLQAIDAVHRAGLTRLMAAIQGMAGEAFVNRLLGDPAIRLLLMSYELVAVDRRLQAEEALDAVRGHLHAHGVDVELREVVGGVVYVRLHGRADVGTKPEAVRQDLEAALKEGLLGFQELVLGDREPPARAPALLPLASLTRMKKPTYQRALALDELTPGAVRGVDLGGRPVLVARVGDDVHALSNRCGESPLPLEFSRLEGHVLVCSWHGCRYDVRSGAQGGGLPRLPVFPVRIEDGMVLVALGVENMVPGR